MAENKTNTATYKGFGVVIQEDTKKEASTGFNFEDSVDLEKRIKSILSTNDYYYLIKHDKDTQEDGTPKRTHYHVVFSLQSKHSKAHFLEALSNAIGQHTDSISIDDLKSVEGAVRYLLHLDNPEKYPYNEWEILTNDNKLKRFIVGQEAWLIESMKDSANIREFTDKVGLDIANKYRGIAKDYIKALDEHTKEELYEARQTLNYIKWMLDNDDNTADMKIKMLKTLFK